MFKLNPEVSDVAETYGTRLKGVTLLVLGAIEAGGSGCACPENVLLRALVAELVLHRKDAVIMDMEAGIEHLGRGTAEGGDRMLIVVEPGWASLQTAARIVTLAADIGVVNLGAVANKLENDEDVTFVRGGLPPGLPLLAHLPFDRNVERMARNQTLAADAPFERALAGLLSQLERAPRTRGQS
jgi:CO dehydrogenase maturation factor